MKKANQTDTRMARDTTGRRWQQAWDAQRGWLPQRPPGKATGMRPTVSVASPELRTVRVGGHLTRQRWDAVRGWVPSGDAGPARVADEAPSAARALAASAADAPPVAPVGPPLGHFAGTLDVDHRFPLRCSRLLLLADRAAFTLAGRDVNRGEFTVDAIALRDAEGNYHARAAALSWAQVRAGQATYATLTLTDVQWGGGRSLEVEGVWRESGKAWRLSGTLAPHTPPASAPKPLAERTPDATPVLAPDVLARLPRLGILTASEARAQARNDALSRKHAKARAQREHAKAEAVFRATFVGPPAPVRPVARKPPSPPPATKRPKLGKAKSATGKNVAHLRVKRCPDCGTRIVWVGNRVRRAYDVTRARKVGPRHACSDRLPKMRVLQGGAFESNRRRH